MAPPRPAAPGETVAQPFVSIVTPTYNRRRFIPQLIKYYRHQTYPTSLMEYIVLDDGTDPVGDLFDPAVTQIPSAPATLLPGLPPVPGMRYIRHDGPRLTIGAKRNRLNRLARGKIIICMDDDDYYPPTRVAHAVQRLVATASRGVELAGSSQIYMYYVDIGEIWSCGPYGPNHGTNGTLAYRRAYARSHLHDETVAVAEEKSFLDSWAHPMVQLDPMHVMLVFAHYANTFNKRGLRDRALGRRRVLLEKEEAGEKLNPQENHELNLIKKTGISIKTLIRDAATRDFYKDMGAEMRAATARRREELVGLLERAERPLTALENDELRGMLHEPIQERRRWLVAEAQARPISHIETAELALIQRSGRREMLKLKLGNGLITDSERDELERLLAPLNPMEAAIERQILLQLTNPPSSPSQKLQPLPVTKPPPVAVATPRVELQPMPQTAPD